jgi:O-antigen ligase
MDSIYNFLKNVWQTLKTETKDNPSFFFVLIFLITIPLSLAVSNSCLALFLISSFLSRNKEKTNKSRSLIFPALLFLIMCLSYFWSIDKDMTLKAIPKESTLFLIPLGFFLMKPFSEGQKQKLLAFFSYAMVGYALYYLFKALIRFIISKDFDVFFYHGEYDLDSGLVPKALNAIHVSVFAGVGYFYFLKTELKTVLNKVFLILLFVFIILLSSKNITLVFFLLNLIYFFFYSKSANKMRLRNLIVFSFILGLVLSFSKIKERFLVEFQTNTTNSISSNVIKNIPEGVHNVSIYEAWNNEKFTPNDFFPGTAFRVYQARLFFDFLAEEPIFWSGFGLNASYLKLEDKGKDYNVFLGSKEHEGYQKKNFHNQYIQVFAELGVFAFILLIFILFINTKNAFKSKDFTHIAFAILMISLFLTESFLWRQRGVVFFTLFYCLFNFQKNSNLIKTQTR